MSQPTSLSPTQPEALCGAERRASIRHYFNLGGAAEPIAVVGDERWRAKVRDLSTTGIGLSCSRAQEPGTLLAVEMQSSDGAIRYTLPVRVVHSRKESRGRYVLGCALVRELSDEELQALL